MDRRIGAEHRAVGCAVLSASTSCPRPGSAEDSGFYRILEGSFPAVTDRRYGKQKFALAKAASYVS
jgi:hypothetical protein